MTWTADLVDALIKHLTDRIALAVLFASGILSLLMLFSSRMAEVLAPYQMLIYGGLLLSACYLPTRIVFDKASELARTHKLHKRLDNLLPDERRILADFVRNNSRSFYASSQDAVAQGLADDGVLYAPNVPSQLLTQNKAYNIQDSAMIYLKKHPEKLKN